MSLAFETQPSTQLRQGALGLGFIVFLVISAAGPLVAIAGGFPIGIMLGNGAGTPSLIIATVAILLMFAAGYTAMSRHITNAGGFCAFTAHGLGGAAGGAAAMLALLGYNAMQIGLYGMFGAVASRFLSAHLGLHAPWWECSLVAMASIAVLGYRRIDLSAKVLSLMVFGEYVVVLILDVVILKAGGAHHIDAVSFTPKAILSGNPAIGFVFRCLPPLAAHRGPLARLAARGAAAKSLDCAIGRTTAFVRHRSRSPKHDKNTVRH